MKVDKAKNKHLIPLKLFAAGWTINGGGKEEEQIINNCLDIENYLKFKSIRK